MIYSMANINFTLFSDLKNIDLSRNQIEIIPAEISKLPFLEVLNLSYNKLVYT
jgi:Leucine-rich repeat (LRR) protein